jgi:hypothetical protein
METIQPALSLRPHALTPSGWLSRNAVEDLRLEPGQTIEQVEEEKHKVTGKIQSQQRIFPGLKFNLNSLKFKKTRCKLHQHKTFSNKSRSLTTFMQEA